MSFDEIKNQIAFRLKSHKVNDVLEPTIKNLKTNAKIEYQKAADDLKLPPPQDTGMPFTPVEEKGAAKAPVKELRLMSGSSCDLRSLADRFLRTADPQVLISSQ